MMYYNAWTSVDLNGGFVAECAEVPGAIGLGPTYMAALVALSNALKGVEVVGREKCSHHRQKNVQLKVPGATDDENARYFVCAAPRCPAGYGVVEWPEIKLWAATKTGSRRQIRRVESDGEWFWIPV